jgi:flagellar hook-basal body complex protein FliE
MAGIGGVGGVGGAGAAAGGAVGGAAGARLDTGGVRIPVGGGSGGSSFADTLKQALGEVSALQETSRDAIAAFVRGDAVELHQVMAAAEEAGIALEMLIEVRNKFIEAYRTLVNMQS